MSREEILNEYDLLCKAVGDAVFSKADLEGKLAAVNKFLTEASKKRDDLKKQLENASVQDTPSES